MKAFYVIMLVLVAGAVPSRGRTESEGAVFNKTQPHESMNNVTVSSSKLESYDNLYLVMQWPKSFCNYLKIADRQCSQPAPGRFTVHGLWPQLSGRGIDCTSRRIYGQYPRFKRNQLDQRFVPNLNYFWPDLTSSVDNNRYFWEYEYNKHGSCTFRNQNEYFQLTLALVQDLERRGLSRIGGQIIIPGDLYWPDDIKSAVRDVTSKLPRLHCVKVGDIVHLLEIRFCAVQNDNRLSLTDCSSSVDCGNEGVYLPP